MRNDFRKSFLIVAAAVLAIAAYFIAGVLIYANNQYNEINIERLEAAVRILEGFTGSDVFEDEQHATQWAYGVSRFTPYRLTLIDRRGEIFFDSDADTAVMEGHIERREFQAAVRDGIGTDRRRSATLGEYHFYAAAAVFNTAGEFAGVVRLSFLIPGFFYRLLANILPFLIVGFLVILCACVALYRYSRFLSLSAETYLENELNKKSEALAANDKKAQTERFHRDVILNSMTEGIITVDENLNIILANPSLCAQFDKEKHTAETISGMPLLEFSDSVDLVKAAEKTALSGTAAEFTASRYSAGKRQYLRAFCAPLEKGAIIALRDISQIVRLELVRKDFVANVSHELRTPVQVIQGFAENMLSALDDKDQINHFAKTIAKNAKSMEALINDLLLLTSLEDENAARPPMEDTVLLSVINEAVQMLSAAASKKDITVAVSCPPDLTVQMYETLFVHALVNLLDNSIKYSHAGSSVHVNAVVQEQNIVIEVSDSGIGIAAEHLDRIFERFYRVDKARQRAQANAQGGGTGLGLSIARHIALLHKGTVEAQSYAGEGSVFRLRMPAPARRGGGHRTV